MPHFWSETRAYRKDSDEGHYWASSYNLPMYKYIARYIILCLLDEGEGIYLYAYKCSY